MTDLLRRVPLLEELPDAELDHLAATLQVVQLGAGGVLFREGDSGESLYILIEGCLEILLGMGSRDETRLATMGPGEFIGEMSLFLPGGLRSASVRACEPARLWTMTRQDFDALLTRQPQMAFAMVQILTRRLDASNAATFRDLQEKNRQLQQAYDELKAAQAQIIEKERLERELQVAAEIQMSILPRTLPTLPGFDFGACMNPARAVGGDFYDIVPLDETRVAVLIGDVTDKGVPAAIFMARVHALIAAEMLHIGTPRQVLAQANQVLTYLAQNQLFATVVYGVLDSPSGEFTYVRAGHEVPMLLTVRGVEELPHQIGQPLGLFDKPLLDEGTVTLSPGSTLLLFTDGMTDCCSPQGVPFGHACLQRELAGMTAFSAQAVCDGLARVLAAYQSGSAQDDDITLVAIHAR
ncbi:MAG: SpoIIE family protein phosphatase [Anaerolineales bacterium]|nr:SpoIIE family protein phosphatase [Anaerolineales bacterium]